MASVGIWGAIFLAASALFGRPAAAHQYDAKWGPINGPWGMVATPDGGVLVVETR